MFVYAVCVKVCVCVFICACGVCVVCVCMCVHGVYVCLYMVHVCGECDICESVHVNVCNAGLPHGDLSRRIKAFRPRK